MTEIVRGDGLKYALSYNAFHNLESIGIDGKDEKLVKYTYKNGNGRLKQITYANGNTMKALYNSAGQMVAEKWFETEAKANDANAAPIAHYKYVYDGDGNIVRSIDIYGKKEYNYEYEEGRIVRAAEADIVIDAQETIVSKNIVDTLRFTYNKDRKIAKKHFTSADFSHTVYYEHSDEDNVVVKFTANNNTVTCHSKTDSFGRKEFEEIQLGSGFVSRLFSYHAGAVTDTHKTYSKLKSTATTVLVSQIVFAKMFWISAYPTTIIAHSFIKTITRLERIFLTRVEKESPAQGGARIRVHIH